MPFWGRTGCNSRLTFLMRCSKKKLITDPTARWEPASRSGSRRGVIQNNAHAVHRSCQTRYCRWISRPKLDSLFRTWKHGELGRCGTRNAAFIVGRMGKKAKPSGRFFCTKRHDISARAAQRATGAGWLFCTAKPD